ncbi:MAG TPA: COR domain-containing protein [Flavobacterium sp.]|uniref:leucine-rich repeat domain-containing protein n=1 Tax=unclassified Flavobacterium TaxID=196869 RepID=UPI0025BEC171|nr:MULTISPECIES: COR domain-containing protein [unclassified Flavobacterium]HRE76670.1 COR domain-containing protein [Flavobacterium sp.]
MKPKNILFIESKLNTEFKEVNKKELLLNYNETSTYLLKEGKIIGLNIINSQIDFIDYFPDLKILVMNGSIENLKYSELSQLSELYLEENDISNIDFLESFTSLEILEVRHNNLSDISILSKFHNLIKLNLWSNKISDLSPLSKLKNLNHLTLWDNNIEDISSLSNLENLSFLDLDGNKIKSLAALKRLKKIKMLYISENQIEDISPLAGFSNLTSLSMRNNPNVNIQALGNIKNLSTLDLGECNIRTYWPISQLTKLTNLSLVSNGINDLSFLTDLKALETLNLSFNLITDISPLKNLFGLRELFLQNNLITDISPLGNKDEIVILNLSSNKIKDIRAILPIIEKGIQINLTFMPRSSGLIIENNPLEYPPQQTIKQGNQAIIRFFEKIVQEGEDTIYEAKLTLVGEGSAGKTSLVRRLLDSKAPFPEEKNRTRGISIVDWVFKIQKNKKHMAHIWDFGGQDVYYPVHRFFITENSVFVLLASSRQNTHHFDYWIPTIYQFGGKSPIILGQTCHDGNTANWNDIGEYVANENFNIIKDSSQYYHEINLPKSNKGLSQIKKSIINQIVALPHYRRNVPKSWVPVREMIYNLKSRNCISYIDLKEQIVKSNPDSFKSREDVEDCIKFFHSIGILLWYHTENQLKDWVILNPKWAVDAVYKIIDYKKNSNKGIILSEDFDLVWKAKIYEDKHTILKDMLEVFKIAFPKKNNKSNYIMPTRLHSMEIKDIWKDDLDNYLRIEYHYEFMPKGLVNQISAELSRFILDDNEVWNNGVNFYDNGTSSQVFEDFYKRRITVKAKGDDARGLMMIIMNSVKDITDGYKGVVPRIIIPCTCQKCLSKKDSTTFSYEMLLDKIMENKDAKVFCNISEESFRVESLLYNIGLPNPEKKLKDDIEKKDSKIEMKTIKLFLASSSELAEERKSFREFISIENDRLHKKGIYFQIIQWEYFLDEMSTTRLQDEYNKMLKECDIALCLFFTKVGKFTEEEFDTAYEKFIFSGSPKIWTYFKSGNINTNEIHDSINSLLKFKEKLKNLGHFQSVFDSNSNLHLQFKRQLELYLDN